MSIKVDCPEWSSDGTETHGHCRKKVMGGRPARVDCNGICLAQVTIKGRAARKTSRRRPPAIEKLHAIFREVREGDDRLIGTRLEEWFKDTGVERSAEIWESKTGIPCGCTWRRDRLNEVHSMGRTILAALRRAAEAVTV